MHSARSARKTVLKRIFIQFSILLVILGGLQPVMTVPVEAAGAVSTESSDAALTATSGITPLATCPEPAALINGSFEEPAYTPGDPKTPTGPGYTYPQDENVPGWQTTDSTGRFDIFVKSLMDQIAPGSPGGTKHEVIHGQQFAEINSYENATLYQDVETTPGQTIYWRLAHKGRFGIDTMSVNIGSSNIAPKDVPSVRTMSTDKDAWKYYSGSYIVPAGQTVTRFGFEAISSANGNITGGNFIDDIFLGTEPCVVADKTVSPQGEASAGQELTYTVIVKNNGGDIAANAVFEDSIPAGTEFIPGSILVDGQPVDDSRYDSSKDMIVIDLGDVPNVTQLPQGKTIQFKVKVLSGYGGIIATNQAIIKYENLLTNKSEEVATNEVSTSIGGEANVCPAPVAMINGSFEQGAVKGSAVNGSGLYYYESEVPGWKTTDDANGYPVIELWDWARNNPSVVKNWPAPPDGGKWAELNAFENGMLYQDVKTTPGQTIYWRLSHMGRNGVDTMQLRIGAATANPYDAEVQRQMTDDKTAWGTYTGTYKVPAGQKVTRFGFEAVSTASASIGAGNFIDDIFLGTAPCVTANKTASPQEVSAGDEVTYAIQIKNEGGDIAADASVTDLIPAGTEYVPGSMKLTQGSTTKDLTDADDTDEGRFDRNQVSIQLGDLANTSQLADGVTVQFKVKVLASAANQQIKNKALISYGNLLTGDTEKKETNETTTPVRFNPPVLESNKSAVLQTKAAGNTDPDHPEPGDTLRYTIQARNTALNSFVSSLVISDDLPAGLQYVPGSLKVDDVSVTDDESDQDGGFYTDGQVIGLFGDITDTEWHTLEFEAVIATGQAGKNIRNTAVAGGENVSTPSNAEEVVQVYPRHPVVESEKIAENLDTGKTHFEVGDTVVYTIRTRTVTDDAYISNLKITDTLPAGLKYVPGSLKVDGKTATDEEGDDNGHYVTGDVYGVTGAVYGGFGDIWDKEWHVLQFHATIQTGQAGKDIRNIADVSGDNFDEPSRPEEEVKVYPRDPVIVSEKSATNLEAGKDTFEVGDTAIYSIRTRTVIGDTYMANLVISDTLPAGLEYIPGSLKVDGVSVTDDKDSDKGHYASGQVVGNVGDVWDTKWHTLEFRAKIVANAGTSIRNTGEITGDNIDQPSRPTDEIVVEEGDTPPVDPPVDPP
ncbi:isopeptide-forming domain-containing fimbrial protein, partial [Paenibacillus lautus]|uniref:isopeptide-forming domain-containing fimbrial protein n=1 Tax=Paenibacillus lautus TaxID=1401 RepID=UPI001C0F693C